MNIIITAIKNGKGAILPANKAYVKLDESKGYQLKLSFDLIYPEGQSWIHFLLKNIKLFYQEFHYIILLICFQDLHPSGHFTQI